MASTRGFLTRYLFTILACAIVLFFGCSAQQKAFPDCNCIPQKALINEVSIHTLQTARFSYKQMIEYMRGKCLFVDSLPTDQFGHIFFYPVLICGIPGKLTSHDPEKGYGANNKFLYDFTTTLDFADSMSTELGITLPPSITSNDALHDTLGHRVHNFGGPDNDSTALYWHGIDFGRLLGRMYGQGAELAIKDSTEWSTFLPGIKQWYEERGIPLARGVDP